MINDTTEAGTGGQRLVIERPQDPVSPPLAPVSPSVSPDLSSLVRSDRHRSGPALQAVILPGGDDSSPEVARGAGSTGPVGVMGSQGQGAWVSAGGGERAQAGDAVDDETGPAAASTVSTRRDCCPINS
jgi:hypothetical protein